MSLNTKRLLAALYFGNRIIQGHFPLRAFIASNMSNPFRGAHSWFCRKLFLAETWGMIAGNGSGGIAR